MRLRAGPFNKISYYDDRFKIIIEQEEETMEIAQSYMTLNPCYKAGKKITVKGIVLHSVGCPQPSAEVFVKRLNSAEAKVCVHAFIDADTGKIYQTLPWDYKAWHCGGSGNSTHIGVEMCEPSCMKYTGGATIVCSQEERARETVRRTLNAAVELFADLCVKYGLDPLGKNVIISHKEGHDRGMASGHGDPDHLFRQLHMNYSMDDFRKAVADKINGTVTDAAKDSRGSGEAQPEKTGAAQPEKAGTVQPEKTGTVRESEPDIRIRNAVSLRSDAVYYSGREMPAWVRNDKWIIKSVAGDRAVLGKNVSGTHEINSPVHTKYLIREEAGDSGEVSGQAKHPEQRGVSGQTESPGQMSVSDQGVELVAKFEGCRLEAYKCPAGVWTIGYGHTAGVKPGDRLTSGEEAKRLLKEDLKKYGDYVNDCVKKGLITFPLNQNQFDALTSFCYNCGNGSLQKLVTGRDAGTVAEKLPSYNKGGGKVLPGLTRRREEERRIFLS